MNHTYKAKCGETVTHDSGKKFVDPIMESDKPFLSSPQVEKPDWCNYKCLYKHRQTKIAQFNTETRQIHYVYVRRCRFYRIEV